MLTTKSSRVLVSVILILIGVITGILLTANLNMIHSGRASADSERRTQLEEKMAAMKDFGEGFSAVAEYVTPSVVTVETEKTVKVNYSPFGYEDPFGDFFGDDDLFKRFFGGPRGQQQQEQKLQGLGSGVIVSEDGYVLTNNHVIAEADKIIVTLSSGKSYQGKLIGRDPRTDIAVVKIDEKGLPAIKMANSDNIKVGQWAIAVGNPFSKSLSQTVTAGIISGMSRSSVGLDTDVDFLQTDAAINPGNSGGALVNMSGELLGINTAILSRSGGYEGIGFAIPANTAKNILDQIIKNGKVSRGYVGVGIQDVDESVAKALKLNDAKGAVINQIVKDSPADRAGLKTGDVILKVDGKVIDDATALRKTVSQKRPGSDVELTIFRDGKEMNVKLILAEAPGEAPTIKEDVPAKNSSVRLGISASGLNADIANKYGVNPNEKGVIITQVDKNGPAYRGGLREGDVIKRVGRKDIESVKDFNDAIGEIGKGDTALFLINRRGGSMFIAFSVPN